MAIVKIREQEPKNPQAVPRLSKAVQTVPRPPGGGGWGDQLEYPRVTRLSQI